VKRRLTARSCTAALTVTVCLVAGGAPAFGQSSYCASYELPRGVATQGFNKPMDYRVSTVRGKRVLIAEGQIRTGEAERLKAAIDRSGAIDEVWFNSPGGAAEEGLNMGRVLRAGGLFVRLPARYACASACSYAFLGGALRVAEPGSFYGVHMFTGTADDETMLLAVDALNEKTTSLRTSLTAQKKPKAEIDAAVAGATREFISFWEQRSAKLAALRARYLVEMSLSLEFMTDAFGQSASGVCFLSPAGLQRYNISNTG
jgi:hypothetical protein